MNEIERTRNLEIINRVFREETGFTNANAISWTNVGKPVCLRLMEEVRKEARKEFLNSEAIKDFTDYCIDVRGDWSDFDGRELLKVWTKTLEKLKQSLEEKDHTKEVQELRKEVDSGKVDLSKYEKLAEGGEK
jgi:hypothetical protein